MRLSQLATPWLPAIVAVLCYLNTLGGTFTYDDKAIVRDNPRIRQLSDARGIWLSDWWDTPGADRGEGRDRLYRPLTLLTFAIDYQLQTPGADGAPTPFVFHLSNTLLHALATLLCWFFLRRVFDDSFHGAGIATIGALVFAVHPVHCEAVANIVGRAEILATIFLLGGLVALGDAERCTLRRTALAATLFLAALLSKETAICYPAVALLWLWRHRVPRPARWWLARAALLLAPLLLYLPLRYIALDHQLLRAAPVGVLFNPVITAEGAARFWAPLSILGTYARLLLFPLDLSCDYGGGVLNIDGLTLSAMIGVVTAAGLLFLAARGFDRNARGASRSAAAFSGMFIASYLLISNTVLLIGVAVAERLMYWPSAIAIALALILLRPAFLILARRTSARTALRAAAGAAGIVVVAFATRSVLRNAEWHDEARLYAADFAKHPESPQLAASVASVHVLAAEDEPDIPRRRAALRIADRLLERSLRRFPVNGWALHLRAQVRYRLLDPTGARTLLLQCLALSHPPSAARGFLERLDGAAATADERRTALKEECDRYPTDPTPRMRLADLLLDANETTAAVELLREAAQLDRQDAECRYLLGVALANSGDRTNAIAAFRETVQIDPENAAAYANLAVTLAPVDPRAALAAARDAARVAPRDVDALSILFELATAAGERAEAEATRSRLLSLLTADDPRRRVLEAAQTAADRDRK